MSERKAAVALNVASLEHGEKERDPWSVEDGAVQHSEALEQLERILTCGDFEANERRKSMLRFVVEEALAGRKDELKAVTIAIAVFGRDASFDQQADPIVRVEARRLRWDLDNYYAGPGQTDPVRISIPKGRYVPAFERTADRFAASDLQSNAAESPAASTPSPGVLDTWLRRGTLVLATFALLAVVVLQIWGQRDTGAADSASASVAPRGASIRVEPLSPPAADESETVLGERMAIGIASKLLKFPDLQVHLASQPSSAQVPQTDFVVRGSVRSKADGLEIRVDLLESADNRLIWSDRFQRVQPGSDVAGIEESLAAAVVGVIGQKYGIVDREVDARLSAFGVDPSLDSYVCVSHAFLWRRAMNTGETDRVFDCLEAAVLRDPDYATAWAMLAFVRMDYARHDRYPDVDRETGLLRAREAALRAISVDPQNYEAYKALSHVEQIRGNFEATIEHARQAVALNPYAPDALAHLATRLAYRGEVEEALPLMEEAIARSVAPIPYYFHVPAIHHMLNGNWEEMHKAASMAIMDGSGASHSLMAVALGGLGKPEAAQSHLEIVAERWPMLYSDPARALALQNVDERVISAFVDALPLTGWSPPTE